MKGIHAPRFAALLLVAGCGSYNFNNVPACKQGEVLTGDGTNLSCVVGGGGGGGLGTGAVPTCASGQVLTSTTKDAKTSLACVDPSMTNSTINVTINDVTNLKNQITQLQQKIDLLLKARAPVFVGATTATTNGRITKAGSDIGIPSATAYCVEEFGAGAHMCTVAEMYGSVAAGVLTAKDTVVKSWVYAPSWQNPLPGSQQPLAGMGDNCSSYTYPTNDRKWSGVAVEWKDVPTTARGFWWHGGTEALCNQMLPIACCK